MPPALRRSASSPSVRIAAAPYPSPHPLSLSPMTTSSSQSATARTRPGRRRGASDANTRRVLAEIEWWRVMQGQRSEDREPENERDGENDPDDDANLTDVDSDVPRTRLRTPESPGSLYTLREDMTTSTATLTHQGPHHYEYQGHRRGASDSSSEGGPPSSTDSTPPRAPSLPLETVSLGIFASHRPRIRMRSPSGDGLLASASASASASALESGSSPFTPHAASAGIFVSSPTVFLAPSTTSAPELTVPTHSNIFAPPTFPPPYSISLSHMDTDLNVGIYTAASHTQRHRHRSSSFPGLVAAVNAFALGAEEGTREAV